MTWVRSGRAAPQWLPADTVVVEPVSTLNSLLTGKRTGNFSFLGCFSAQGSLLAQWYGDLEPNSLLIGAWNFFRNNKEFSASNREFSLRMQSRRCPSPFIHKSIRASISAKELHASKSIFAAMICSRPANRRVISSTPFECRMIAIKCSPRGPARWQIPSPV